jgi:hypothetical protein
MKPLVTVKSAVHEEDTGLPWLGTWTRVYLVVIINFLLWVVLLVALTACFS